MASGGGKAKAKRARPVASSSQGGQESREGAEGEDDELTQTQPIVARARADSSSGGDRGGGGGGKRARRGAAAAEEEEGQGDGDVVEAQRAGNRRDAMRRVAESRGGF